MTPMRASSKRGVGWLWWVVLAAWAGLLTGCGTVEGDSRNSAARPWNTPKYWEGGMPTSINEGR